MIALTFKNFCFCQTQTLYGKTTCMNTGMGHRWVMAHNVISIYEWYVSHVFDIWVMMKPYTAKLPALNTGMGRTWVMSVICEPCLLSYKRVMQESCLLHMSHYEAWCGKTTSSNTGMGHPWVMAPMYESHTSHVSHILVVSSILWIIHESYVSNIWVTINSCLLSYERVIQESRLLHTSHYETFCGKTASNESQELCLLHMSHKWVMSPTYASHASHVFHPMHESYTACLLFMRNLIFWLCLLALVYW